MSLPEAELERVRALAPVEGAWLVGGSVRDLLRGAHITDIDLVVAGDPGKAARRLAGAIGGSPFPLSERHGAWRVTGAHAVIDIAAARGSIEADMRQRDFTMNAMALPLDGGDLVDPCEGRSDLAAGVLRMVSETSFEEDPLRLMRLARLARDLGSAVDPHTARRAREQAALATRAAGERIYMELRRLLASADPAAGVELLHDLGLVAVILPELAETEGVGQNRFHHLDVYAHTLQVLDAVADIADHPRHYLPGQSAAIAAELARPVGDELDERVAVRFAALFHDIRKPQTKRITDDGRISFMGHDREGADAAEQVLRRWNASTAMIRFCRVMVHEHLRLGFLVKERPISSPARIPVPARYGALSAGEHRAFTR